MKRFKQPIQMSHEMEFMFLDAYNKGDKKEIKLLNKTWWAICRGYL